MQYYGKWQVASFEATNGGVNDFQMGLCFRQWVFFWFFFEAGGSQLGHWAALNQLGLVQALHHQLPQGVNRHAGDLGLPPAPYRRRPPAIQPWQSGRHHRRGPGSVYAAAIGFQMQMMRGPRPGLSLHYVNGIW
jgi:hypothetical protein